MKYKIIIGIQTLLLIGAIYMWMTAAKEVATCQSNHRAVVLDNSKDTIKLITQIKKFKDDRKIILASNEKLQALSGEILENWKECENR